MQFKEGDTSNFILYNVLILKISVLVIILALAVVGLIVGIVQLSSGGSTISTFLTVGIVSILLVTLNLPFVSHSFRRLEFL